MMGPGTRVRVHPGRVGASMTMDASGQMAVELAVLMPVIVVVSLAVYNLGRFVALSATFDRVALDAVLSQGVAPAGSQTSLAAVDGVRACIREALEAPEVCEVVVEAAGDGSGTGGAKLSLSPELTRYRCVLEFRPWPSRFSLAGIDLSSPVVLRHERSFVVDRFHPGVVM